MGGKGEAIVSMKDQELLHKYRCLLAGYDIVNYRYCVQSVKYQISHFILIQTRKSGIRDLIWHLHDFFIFPISYFANANVLVSFRMTRIQTGFSRELNALLENWYRQHSLPFCYYAYVTVS